MERVGRSEPLRIPLLSYFIALNWILNHPRRFRRICLSGGEEVFLWVRGHSAHYAKISSPSLGGTSSHKESLECMSALHGRRRGEAIEEEMGYVMLDTPIPSDTFHLPCAGKKGRSEMWCLFVHVISTTYYALGRAFNRKERIYCTRLSRSSTLPNLIPSGEAGNIPRTI